MTGHRHGGEPFGEYMRDIAAIRGDARLDGSAAIRLCPPAQCSIPERFSKRSAANPTRCDGTLCPAVLPLRPSRWQKD